MTLRGMVHAGVGQIVTVGRREPGRRFQRSCTLRLIISGTATTKVVRQGMSGSAIPRRHGSAIGSRRTAETGWRRDLWRPPQWSVHSAQTRDEREVGGVRAEGAHESVGDLILAQVFVGGEKTAMKASVI